VAKPTGGAVVVVVGVVVVVVLVARVVSPRAWDGSDVESTKFPHAGRASVTARAAVATKRRGRAEAMG
jgi:hypothetical protein